MKSGVVKLRQEENFHSNGAASWTGRTATSRPELAASGSGDSPVQSTVELRASQIRVVRNNGWNTVPNGFDDGSEFQQKLSGSVRRTRPRCFMTIS